jgi:hypothetical protein
LKFQKDIIKGRVLKFRKSGVKRLKVFFYRRGFIGADGAPLLDADSYKEK